jgi:hypothetical protein
VSRRQAYEMQLLGSVAELRARFWASELVLAFGFGFLVELGGGMRSVLGCLNIVRAACGQT